MQAMQKKTRAKGGGRKLKHGEPTVTLAFRVPISKAEDVKQAVGKMLEVPLIDIL